MWGAEARLKGSIDVAAEGKLELWQHVEQVLRQPVLKVQLNPKDLGGTHAYTSTEAARPWMGANRVQVGS